MTPEQIHQSFNNAFTLAGIVGAAIIVCLLFIPFLRDGGGKMKEHKGAPSCGKDADQLQCELSAYYDAKGIDGYGLARGRGVNPAWEAQSGKMLDDNIQLGGGLYPSAWNKIHEATGRMTKIDE